MDPISIFNALYDKKILKIGDHALKSGLVAPYELNLRRLSLYPELMHAVVSQLVDRHLTDRAISETTSRLRRQLSTLSTDSIAKAKHLSAIGESIEPASPIESDVDSQIGEEDASSSCEDDTDVVDHNLDVVLCGLPCAALPIASVAAYKAKLPLLYEPESDNVANYKCPMEDFTADTRSVSEQQLAKQQCVVLISDVICSGQSILDTVSQLEQRNLRVEFVICIVDSEENGIKRLLEEAGIRVLPLYTMSAILRVLEATGRISSQNFLSIRQWITARSQQNGELVSSTTSQQQSLSACQSNAAAAQKHAPCTLSTNIDRQGKVCPHVGVKALA